MPNTFGTISVYDRSSVGPVDNYSGLPTLLLKNKFHFSAGYQINPILTFLHGDLGRSAQQRLFSHFTDEQTGERRRIPFTISDDYRYLIVIDLIVYATKTNLSRKTTLIRRYIRSEHYIPFMELLDKLSSESVRYGENMWEVLLGISPVYEIP
jgi:hypothetical protein